MKKAHFKKVLIDERRQVILNQLIINLAFPVPEQEQQHGLVYFWLSFLTIQNWS